MENLFHRLLYLFTSSSLCLCGQENTLLSWRFVTRSSISGADSENYVTLWCTRSRSSLWPFVVWPSKVVLGWDKNDRGVSFTLGGEVVVKFLHKYDLGLICRAYKVVEDWVWIFCQEAFDHSVVCTWLLSRVWQWRYHIKCGQSLFQIPKLAEKKKPNARRSINISKGYDHRASKEIGVILTLLNWDSWYRVYDLHF